MNRISSFFILTLFLLISACNPYEQDSYEPYYVVESYLIANAALPEVKVSATLPIDEIYTFEKAALSNATVTIQKLGEGGLVQETYNYQLQTPGVYFPVDSAVVIAEHRYRLTVSFANGDSVSSQTFVPGNVKTMNALPDSVLYQAPKQVEARITPSFYPGRQTYFIFSLVINGTPSIDQLTPFYADVFDEDEMDISDFYINSSPILNEKNYEENPDGTLSVLLPWAAVAFYGQNQVILNAIDDNMYDFLRSQSVQTGGGTLPPGQIQNIIYHVEGGIGIFGSLASDTLQLFIERGEH